MRLGVCCAALLVIGMPGCRVTGLWSVECTPGDDGTCFAGEVCGADGLCIAAADAPPPGDGGVPGVDAGGLPQPDVETVASGEDAVYLLARATDGTLFWATGGDAGCVRRLAPAATTPQSVHCEPVGTGISGLALVDGDVVWISNGADADDKLRLKQQTAQPATVAATLSTAIEDVGTVESYGPSLLAARSVGEEDYYAWTLEPTNSFQGMERVVRGATGLITKTTKYGVSFGGGRLGGIALTDPNVYVVMESDLYARVLVRDNHATDDQGGYSAYSDNGDNTDYPPGAGWATTTQGDTMYVSTRGAGDVGGILSSRGAFPDGFLAVDLVTAQVDPDSVARYARGLYATPDALYYTTGGLGDSPPGVFRLSLAADAAPERLLTLTEEGGSLVVDDDWITFTVPALSAIQRIPTP